MTAAVILSAAVLGAPPPLDFGGVQVGTAALRTLPVAARVVAISGVGFSATSTKRGVLVVYEPYEPGEEGSGMLVLRVGSRLVHVPLRGRGIDTIRPTITVAAPRAAVPGRELVIRFAAADNDLVTECRLEVGGHVLARRPWPVTSFRWRVPARARRPVRITLVAVDRAGNVASVTRSVRVQPKP